MSRRRIFTDEQCKELSEWFTQLRSMGSVQAKCRQMSVSKGALMDAIARGCGKPRRAIREKLNAYEIERLASEVVSRETDQSEHIEKVA